MNIAIENTESPTTRSHHIEILQQSYRATLREKEQPSKQVEELQQLLTLREATIDQLQHTQSRMEELDPVQLQRHRALSRLASVECDVESLTQNEQAVVEQLNHTRWRVCGSPRHCDLCEMDGSTLVSVSRQLVE